METWSAPDGTDGGGAGWDQPASVEGIEEATGTPDGVTGEVPAGAADQASEGVTGAPIPEASLDAVEIVLDQVDAALARLDDGSYGRCVSCGGPIDDSRLAGDPTVLACRDCAQQELIGATDHA
jgi:hypothetical protein